MVALLRRGAASGRLEEVDLVARAAGQATGVTALADITGLSLPMDPDVEYALEALLLWRSTATTTGVRFALAGPGTPAEVAAAVEIQTTATAWALQTHTAYGAGAATTGIDTANTTRLARITGSVRNGATSGPLRVQVAAEVAVLNAVTVRAGSWLRLTPLA